MPSQLRVQLAAGAEGDLQAIYDRRLKQRGADGPDGADALLESLYEAMEKLAEFPLRGPVPPELEAIGIADWRQVSVWPYRIIYTLEGENLTIAVIADSRRDFAYLLEQRLLRPGIAFVRGKGQMRAAAGEGLGAEHDAGFGPESGRS